jgi:hypothetical protein
LNKQITILIVFVSSVLNLWGQDAPAAEAERRHKAQSYFGAHIDYVYTQLNGIGGNERAEYLSDYVEDLNNNGIAADGGLFGRNALSLGVFYDMYLSKRFALQFQTSYWQTGYKETLNAVGETESYSLKHSYKLNANLDYFHFAPGVKYYNDFGITLTLGAFVNYNVGDRVKIKESKVFSGRFGSDVTERDEELYFHEHFNDNRSIFLSGGLFAIGYKWEQFEFDFSAKITGPILSEIEDKYFNVYQFGIRYEIPLVREDN